MFENEDRSRYYGKRIGDVVRSTVSLQKPLTGFVCEFGGTDNNCVFVKPDDGGQVVKCVAEWLEIVKPVTVFLKKGARVKHSALGLDQLKPKNPDRIGTVRVVREKKCTVLWDDIKTPSPYAYKFLEEIV